MESIKKALQAEVAEKIVALEEVKVGGEGEAAYTIYRYTLENGYSNLVATTNAAPVWRANDEALFDEAYGL